MTQTTRKILNAKDVFMMTVAANLGPRWISVAAALGLVSLTFWFFGALFFLIPISLIVVELATQYPEEGGIYIWVQRQLGHKASFIVAWCYWVNNFFLYPAILLFFASSFVYAFGDPELANNQTFIMTIVLIAFWAILFLTLSGIKMGKIAGLLGGTGTSLIILILVVLGFTAFFTSHTSATPLQWKSLLPTGSLIDNLSSFSLLMFAMAGVEIIPTVANSIQNPHKVLPKTLIFFAFFLFFAYALATLAMQLIVNPAEIHNTTGLVKSFHLVGQKLHLPFLARFLAAFLAISELAALSLWLLLPAIMFFKTTDKGILPEFFHRENKKGIPANALLLEGVAVSFILLCTRFLPSVHAMYQLLVLMTTIVYFIPYGFLVIAYIRFKRKGGNGPYTAPGGKRGGMILGGLVLLSLAFAIGASFIPTPNLKTASSILIYELELVGGTLGTVLIALYLYRRRASR